MTTSEAEFAADLDDASRGGIGDLARRRTAHAAINGGSAARSAADQSAGTDRILVVVPGIEEVSGDSEVHVLGNREVLPDAHIPVVDAGLAQRSCGSELPYTPSAGCVKQSELIRCITLVRFA